MKAVKILKKLYWLGLIGMVGTIINSKILELFYLFFLAALADFILSLILVCKSGSETKEVSNLKFLFQNVGMLIGIPVIYLRNGFRLPNVSTYRAQRLYRLPFEGEWMVVNGGIDKAHSHSWGVCSQRYAYDFYIRNGEETHSGDGTSVTDYFCYNQAIVAPADGVIVELKDKFEDTPVSGKPEIQCTASDVRGNYIVIKHAEREYSTIAHIKKNSFLVKVGDTVKEGQEIARCGNSGNTSEPHIHFQIQQGQSFLFNASLPITFHEAVTSDGKKIAHLTAGQMVGNK